MISKNMKKLINFSSFNVFFSNQEGKKRNKKQLIKHLNETYIPVIKEINKLLRYISGEQQQQ